MRHQVTITFDVEALESMSPDEVKIDLIAVIPWVNILNIEIAKIS